MSDHDLSSFTIEELYDWVNERYNEYSKGAIKEEDYLEDLEYYKTRLASSQEDVKPEVKSKTDNKKLPITRVRSTSIAGLRKKLMDELKK